MTMLDHIFNSILNCQYSKSQMIFNLKHSQKCIQQLNKIQKLNADMNAETWLYFCVFIIQSKTMGLTCDVNFCLSNSKNNMFELAHVDYICLMMCDMVKYIFCQPVISVLRVQGAYKPA